jgi:aryl-alcohol dehydrogenase-like predicted oxidoreductase
MDYRRLGSTGLRISRLGLGCGNFGGVGSAPAFFGMGETEAQAFDLMDRALDAGINFFDTANAYGGGRSETYIGRWLKAKGSAARQQLLLSSKVFNPVGPGPNDRGLSRRHILQQVDESLTRLQTDRLDMYLIHEPDPETLLDETIQALDDVVRMGKVIYVGASNIEAWRLARGLWISDKSGLCRFDWVQNSFSLLDRTPEREMFLRRPARGIHGIQPARRRVADRKVPGGGGLSRSLADDAASGAVSTSRARRRVSGIGCSCRGGARPRCRNGRARDCVGASSSACRRGHRRPTDCRAPRRGSRIDEDRPV